MYDDYYNNKFSQKMLPFFDIPTQNIVLSTLHIFIGVAFNAFSFLIKILKETDKQHTIVIQNIKKILKI